MTEIHPVALAFDDEGVDPGELRLAYPYWSHRDPIRTDGRSYADPEAPTDGLVAHSWDHSLGEIVTSIADTGLRLEFLHEFDFVRWQSALPRRGRRRTLAPARRFEGRAPALLLAQGDEARDGRGRIRLSRLVCSIQSPSRR